MTHNSFGQTLSMLIAGRVEFVLIGGLAAMAAGSTRATFDVDVVYSRSISNITRLASTLRPHSPYLRGVPRGLPFAFDAQTIRSGLNFTLTTSLGALDLLGEVAGGGTYEELLPDTRVIELFELQCRCVTLEKLIELKRAAGRPKDLEVIAELEILRDFQA